MPDPDPQIAVLITHVVFQTKVYVQFLVQQNRIPRKTANDLFSKLDSPHSPVTGLTGTGENRRPRRTRNAGSPVRRSAIAPPNYEAVMKHDSLHSPGHSPVSPVITTELEISQLPAQLSIRPPVKARALWDWYEKGQESFHFNKGDLIEVVEEVDADWWYGKHKGCRGYFPSNYVRKIPDGVGAGLVNISPPPPILFCVRPTRSSPFPIRPIRSNPRSSPLPRGTTCIASVVSQPDRTPAAFLHPQSSWSDTQQLCQQLGSQALPSPTESELNNLNSMARNLRSDSPSQVQVQVKLRRRAEIRGQHVDDLLRTRRDPLTTCE
ncbi:SH3-domain-containing protein [Rickenella mellea]|uniref:SH3-domain-containing protein n=1 Tax=Rickenella mellea TaxID=50990 RepID=A0A4Y7PMQ3_9AGAM|nr:SH3-domain-containing protein [Rickenella mellea]